MLLSLLAFKLTKQNQPPASARSPHLPPTFVYRFNHLAAHRPCCACFACCAVAISLGLDSFPATDMPPGAAPYPPVAFVHFPKDTYSDGVRAVLLQRPLHCQRREFLAAWVPWRPGARPLPSSALLCPSLPTPRSPARLLAACTALYLFLAVQRIQEMVGFMKGAGIPSAEARVGAACPSGPLHAWKGGVSIVALLCSAACRPPPPLAPTSAPLCLPSTLTHGHSQKPQLAFPFSPPPPTHPPSPTHPVCRWRATPSARTSSRAAAP